MIRLVQTPSFWLKNAGHIPSSSFIPVEMNKFIESMSSLGEESQTEDSSETTTSSSTSSDDSEDEAMSPRDFRVSASFFI